MPKHQWYFLKVTLLSVRLIQKILYKLPCRPWVRCLVMSRLCFGCVFPQIFPVHQRLMISLHKVKITYHKNNKVQLFIQFEPWNFSSKDYDNAFPLCKKDYELDHTLRIIEINKSSVIILKTTVPISKQFSTCCKRTHNSCLSLNNKLQSRRNIIQTNIKLIFYWL